MAIIRRGCVAVIRIPRHARCFLLEDSEERIAWFVDRLPSIDMATNVHDAVEILAQKEYDFVFLDHDLGLLDYAGYCGPEGSGKDVARYLSGRGFIGHNVLIHSWNSIGAAAMKDILEGAMAIPFGQFEIEFSD
jgi:hypothetical protein